MELFLRRLQHAQTADAVVLPDPVRLALEAYKCDLISLFRQMTKVNQDVDFLERQADCLLNIYNKELEQVIKVNK